jgi:hypothetical protein
VSSNLLSTRISDKSPNSSPVEDLTSFTSREEEGHSCQHHGNPSSESSSRPGDYQLFAFSRTGSCIGYGLGMLRPKGETGVGTEY